MHKGIAASSGISIGKAYVIKEVQRNIENKRIDDTVEELNRLNAAILQSKREIEEVRLLTEEKQGVDKALIFDAHLAMLEDPELLGEIATKIKSGINAEYAVKTMVDHFVELFEEMNNDYMRERAADIKDVGNRMLNNLMGISNGSPMELTDERIIIAKDLTPSETAQLDEKKVLAFATEIGGKTSHSAIMARSQDIPAVVGLSNITEIVKNSDLLILDGDEGVVIVNPDDELLNEYIGKQEKLMERKALLQKLKNVDAITLDGKRVELAGNIGTPENTRAVLEQGGEGVGLFRTEFLYMDQQTLPTEEEQFNGYKRALEAMGEKPVIIRTLDIGGDKKLSYLPIPDEMNPFLGYRAIRLCLDRKDIFKTQLRAILRASTYGNLKIMFPMISGLEELRQAKAILEEVKEQLIDEGIKVANNIEVGIMIEIPSAAIISDILAKEVDFFSIGSNDLIQYTVAVDRMNEGLAHLYNPFNPAVLRLIKLVVDNGHREGKWVGVCGEMAADIRLLPLLMGFGIDELSMSSSSLLKIKEGIINMEYHKAQNLAITALSLSTAEEIEALVTEFM